MKIIVVGCGKVGAALTAQLSREGHDIAVNAGVLTDISNNYDVMGLIGNGASHAVQLEAGIETADLLVAATDSDELNLLCCLIAKKAGGCNTIARVRNPVYNEEINFIKEELGLSLTVNPEYAAATEAARVLRFPSAVQIETFASFAFLPQCRSRHLRREKLKLSKYGSPKGLSSTDALWRRSTKGPVRRCLSAQ